MFIVHYLFTTYYNANFLSVGTFTPPFPAFDTSQGIEEYLEQNS